MNQNIISDTLTRLRNASKVFHKYVLIKYKKNIVTILEILKKKGLIINYKMESSKYILIELKYNGWWIKNPLFSNIILISKPSKRIYSGYKHFSKSMKNINLKNGLLIVSTSSGIMTSQEAIQLKKGGEILFYIS
jgi:small subunit ribosomal protein S8